MTINDLKKYLSRKNLIIAGTIIGIVVIGIVLRLTVWKAAPKQIYSVAIMVRSQSNPDPVEDRKTSLKAGDVLVVQPDGHGWSSTESISYLMLRMNLTEEQSRKLTQAKERELDEDELSEEEKQRIKDEEERAEKDGREYRREPRKETLIAREYYIDLSRDEFEGFTADSLVDGNPYADKVFDWGIVEKK